MHLLKRLCLLFLFVAVFTAPAHATDYTIAVEGRVTGVIDPQHALDGTEIAEGTTFSTCYTYSDGVVDTNSDDDLVGAYLWATTPYGFAPFQLGNLTLASSNLEIGVGNDLDSGFDGYLVGSDFDLTIGNFDYRAFILIFFEDPDQTALSSDALPLPAPDFSAFENKLCLFVVPAGGDVESTKVIFEITRIEVKSVTPDPVTLIEGLDEDVAALVASGVTLPADGQSLYAKLDAAIAALQVGDVATARTKLEDFINQVRAFISTRKLTAAEGQSLIDAANAILALI